MDGTNKHVFSGKKKNLGFYFNWMSYGKNAEVEYIVSKMII